MPVDDHGGGLHLDVHDGELAVVRLAATAPVPPWASSAPASPLVAITRTPDELSLVVPAASVPVDAAGEVEDGWAALAVRGPLDFALTGILARLATTLAEAGVSIFALSTFDTDWLLVRRESLDRAVGALRGAGHTVHT